LKDKELEFAKNKILGEYKLGLESCEEEEDSLLSNELEKGNAEEFYNFPKKIKKLK